MGITQLTFEAVRYRLASDTGLTTPSESTTTTTGGITEGTYALTVASAASFSAGHGISIAGAGTGGGRLLTWIESVNGAVLTLHEKAVTTVTGAVVSHDDRFVVEADQIQPADGNLPAVFPCIQIRMNGAEGYDFTGTLVGEFNLYVYYQSEPWSIGQPLTVLNLICDRIKDLLHIQGDSISNAAIFIQILREVYKSGVVPETDISETTHSQAMRYEFLSNIA